MCAAAMLLILVVHQQWYPFYQFVLWPHLPGTCFMLTDTRKPPLQLTQLERVEGQIETGTPETRTAEQTSRGAAEG
jgi:hypothetical protein